MFDQDEYVRGQQPGQLPPPMTHPGYRSFLQGQEQARINAERWQRGLDGVYESSRRAAEHLFRKGLGNALKEFTGALIGMSLTVGLIAGVIAHFTHHDTERDALVGAGATAVLFGLYGVILFWVYWVPLAIVAAAAYFGLYKLGIVPSFW